MLEVAVNVSYQQQERKRAFGDSICMHAAIFRQEARMCANTSAEQTTNSMCYMPHQPPKSLINTTLATAMPQSQGLLIMLDVKQVTE